MWSEDEVTCCHILSHTVPAKAVSVSLTVPVAGEAINLVQSGVGFAHGVQFRMSEGALLSQTHGEGGHPKKKREENKISNSSKADAQKQAEGHRGIRGDLQGGRM